jgi:cobaltochelatase CobN
MLLFSICCVSALDNQTTADDVSAEIELDDVLEVPHDQEIQGVDADESVMAESNNGINVHVVHYYNETGKTWDEEGFDLAGATVKL